MRTIMRDACGLGLMALLAAPGAATAQEDYYGGQLRDVVPGVLIQPAEDASAQEALLNAPFLPGDRIWTDATGRVEIQLTTGGQVRLDVRSKLDLASVDAQSATLNLWSGSAFVSHPGGTQVQILVPDGRLLVSEAGRYRVDVYRGDVRVSVYDGLARFESAGRQVSLAAGERTMAGAGLTPDEPQTFDPWNESDAFLAYNDARDAALRTAAGSREYLPEPIQTYGVDFDTSGSWYFEAGIGHVWRPNVRAGWRPYVDGRWDWTSYGWTWIPYERWGWATSHYGRWDWTTSLGWYWIPGRTWGGAWVSWAVGPSYVAWCPLGYRDRPVVVPHHRSGRRYAVPRGTYAPRGYQPRDGGWSYVGRDQMGRRARPRVAPSGELNGGFASAAPGRLGRDLTIARGPASVHAPTGTARPRSAAEVRSELGARSRDRRLPVTRPTTVIGRRGPASSTDPRAVTGSRTRTRQPSRTTTPGLAPAGSGRSVATPRVPQTSWSRPGQVRTVTPSRRSIERSSPTPRTRIRPQPESRTTTAPRSRDVQPRQVVPRVVPRIEGGRTSRESARPEARRAPERARSGDRGYRATRQPTRQASPRVAPRSTSRPSSGAKQAAPRASRDAGRSRARERREHRDN